MPGEAPRLRVAGLLVEERRILMVEQARGEETYWLLPGGGVGFGESLSDALRREFREELGLRVAVNKLLAIIESISPDPEYRKHVVHLVFEVTAAREVPPVPRDEAILAAAFLDEVQLRNVDVRPPINEFLCDCTRDLPSAPQFLGRRW
ncbi:MAG: NUDIX domain-containing protein [Thermoleophilia bacterium]